MMHVELDWRELTDPPVASVPHEAATTLPRALSVPRLHAVDAATAVTAPLMPRVTSADVWLSVALVNQRAEAEVAAARSAGIPHSLRVWRESHQRVLLALAREAVRMPTAARCEAISWEQVGDDYHVTACFSVAPIH